jgi:hypothetical protein
MPGLLRGVARTAVVAGTASAVNGRVQRRQARRFADRDAETYARQQQAYADHVYNQQQNDAPPPPAVEPPPAPPDDMIRQLRELGELQAAGVLTDAEFAAQKARLLAP